MLAEKHLSEAMKSTSVRRGKDDERFANPTEKHTSLRPKQVLSEEKQMTSLRPKKVLSEVQNRLKLSDAFRICGALMGSRGRLSWWAFVGSNGELSWALEPALVGCHGGLSRAAMVSKRELSWAVVW